MSRYLLFLLFLFACRPDPVDTIPLDTQICVRTVHHLVPVPHTTVYLMYNTDTFPGYQQPPGYYNAKFVTGADARGCIAPVPEGTHWLVAFGYDSFYYPHHVFGSMRLNVSESGRAKVDTLFFVSE